MLRLFSSLIFFISIAYNLLFAQELTPQVAVFSSLQKQRLVKMLNNGRSNAKIPAANMKKLVWDNELEKVLLSFLDTLHNRSWFFEKTTKQNPYYPDFKANYNGFRIFNHHTMKELMVDLPGQYQFFFHDTIGGPGKILTGVQARLAQKNCFDYNLCSNNAFDFKSCSKSMGTIGPGQKCVWWYQYYPRFLMAEYESVACIFLGVPGPGSPSGQPNSYWCYGRFSKEEMNTPEGVPYEKGPRCSQCPSSFPNCVERSLCAP